MLHQVKWLAATALIGIGLTGIIAWQKTPPVNHQQAVRDTLPLSEKEYKATFEEADLNKAMEEVKKASENLSKQLQKTNWDRMQKDLLKAQAELQAQNIQAQVENALKNIDLQKTNLRKQLEHLNLDQIQAETGLALQELNMEKLKKNLEEIRPDLDIKIQPEKMAAEIKQSMEQARIAMAELKSVNGKMIQEQLEQAKKALALNEVNLRRELESAQKSLNGETFKKEMEKANKALAAAAAGLENHRKMLEEMEKDGLIETNGSYKIKYKNGELYINGTLQPAKVTEKYKPYFKSDKVTIVKEKSTGSRNTIDL